MLLLLKPYIFGLDRHDGLSGGGGYKKKRKKKKEAELVKSGVGYLSFIPVDDYKISVKEAVRKAELEDEEIEFMMMLLGDD